MLKRVFIIVLSIVMLLGMGGCMEKTEKIETKKYTIDEKKEMALAYLKDRYDEEFEGISYTPKQWGQGHDEFFVYPKNKTKEDAFLVTGSLHKDGTYVVSDGYLGIILQTEYKKVMEEIVSDFCDEFWISVRTIGGAKYPGKYSLQQIMKMSGNIDIDADIFINVKNSSAQKDKVVDVLQGIAQNMKDKRLKGRIWIYIVKDDKYAYLKENTGKIKVDQREYYVYPESKQSPQYTAVVLENIETGKLEIRNHEGEN